MPLFFYIIAFHRTFLEAWKVLLDGWVDTEPTTPQQSDYRSCGVCLLKVFLKRTVSGRSVKSNTASLSYKTEITSNFIFVLSYFVRYYTIKILQKSLKLTF